MTMGSKFILQSPTANAPELMSSPRMLEDTNPLNYHSSMPIIPTTVSTARRRRPSKGSSGPTGIKRSASTPNVRGLAAGEAAMSLAEKRRNKLGYHRTSVACVHCRRRKIRCLLAHDDIQNRCSNCIRLKKECNFFPVDQQPPVERRPRTGSKPEAMSGDTSASSSSSPGGLTAGNSAVEQIDPHFNQYGIQPIASHSYGISMASTSTSLLSPPASAAPIGVRAFEFPPQHDRSTWEDQYFNHGPVHTGHPMVEDQSNGYWGKVSESPMTPFSPYPLGPSSALMQQRDVGGGFAPYGGPRQDPGWSLPPRSMSYGRLEDLPHQYQNGNGYHQPYQMDVRRRASDMHPPSSHTSNNSSTASISEVSHVPVSTPLSNQAIHHLSGATAWHTLTGHSPMKQNAEFGGWYPEAGQLSNVQEEEIPPHYCGDPAIL